MKRRWWVKYLMLGLLYTVLMLAIMYLVIWLLFYITAASEFAPLPF